MTNTHKQRLERIISDAFLRVDLCDRLNELIEEIESEAWERGIHQAQEAE